jgi:hypothetical protein
MASTIKVNTIDTQSGTSITIPTGKTLAVVDAGALTIGGTAITSGSSNILRKTADHQIVEADVSGKSELVIACNASAANRVITLPAVTTTGLANCIVTVVIDTDSTATTNVQVKDIGATEVWTGVQKSDYVRLIVSNSVWVVLDHKETFFEHRALTAQQTVSTSTFAKWAASTSIVSIGNMWSTTDTRLTAPFDCYLDVNINITSSMSNEPSVSSGLKIGTAGAMVTMFHNPHVSADGRITGPTPYNGTHSVAKDKLIEPWFMNNDSDSTRYMTANGTPNHNNQFMFRCTRRY